ncbi:unnamed protein product [Parnassius apollo]|uniref:(apollo) hypothetical protein n=1 Tax=Parnassius apollo TaxID=110799 RepID=A0A8S3Y6P2_PARAO|nr:unnamed protein product [Parnassius apollo]
MILQKTIFKCLRKNVRWGSTQTNLSSLYKDVFKDFDNYVPKIIDDGLANATFIKSAAVKSRIKEVSEYYLIGRRPVQGEFMAFAYDTLENPEVISEELLKKMQVITCTVEMVQTYFFFWDDFEDRCKTRCGKLCWHLRPDTGSLALIDACIMRSFINELIRQNFTAELRDNILRIYNGVYFNGSIGQYLDTIAARSNNYDNFTLAQYNTTNEMKSSFYAIKSPILLGLALANKFNEESYNLVDNICEDIGILVQIHNDVIDVLNIDGSVTGKNATDIQERKCSWVAVTVLEKCNTEQRRIFEENYGSWDPKKIDRIRKIYEEFDVLQMYRQEEKARYEKFLKKVNALPKNATPSAEFFYKFYDLLKTFTRDTTNFMYIKH